MNKKKQYIVIITIVLILAAIIQFTPKEYFQKIKKGKIKSKKIEIEESKENKKEENEINENEQKIEDKKSESNVNIDETDELEEVVQIADQYFADETAKTNKKTKQSKKVEYKTIKRDIFQKVVLENIESPKNDMEEEVVSQVLLPVIKGIMITNKNSRKVITGKGEILNEGEVSGDYTIVKIFAGGVEVQDSMGNKTKIMIWEE